MSAELPTFDLEFEEDVIAAAITNTEFLKKASRILDVHHLATPQHAWIWKQSQALWQKHRERPTARLLLHKAREDFPKDEDREVYVELIAKLYRRKVESPGGALDALSKFVRFVNAQLALEEAAKALGKGKLDDVYATLSQASKRDLRPRDYAVIKWSEEFGERQSERKFEKENPETFTVIPTGFAQLDKILSGGIRIPEVALVMATTGRGKSIMLNNIAWSAIKHGYSTAYFALEMPARQIAMRQDSRWLGYDYKKFKEFDFTEEEIRAINKRWHKMRKRYKNLFRIFSIPVRQADINTIRGALEDQRLDDGFDPTLVLIDSGDHLKGVGRFEGFRMEQTAVYLDLKNFAEEEGKVVISSTHAGRDWAKKIATAEAASETYDKSRIADIVVTLNEPQDKKGGKARMLTDDDDEEDEELEEGKKMIELFLAKYRDGESHIKISLEADFARMTITEA